MTIVEIFYLLGTYLLGGIPFGLIYTKIFKKVDVRNIGSGNIGATNVLRAAGLKVALLTAISDIAKSLIPVYFSKILNLGNYFSYLVWLTAILGHCFSPYLKLKGGKGVATFFGGLLALNPMFALITLLVWLVIIAITRIVSIGSMASSLLPIILNILTKQPWIYIFVSAVSSLIVIYRHKDNIKRLIKGTENKIKLK